MGDPQVELAVANVYRAFEDVPRPAVIEGCPCCLEAGEIDILLSRPLRELSPTDLSDYASSVLLTVGSTEDFLYFLPRILEIVVREPGWCPDAETVARAIRDGGFHLWPENRQEAVKALFGSRLETLLLEPNSGFEVNGWLCAIGRLHIDLAPFLDQLVAHPKRLVEIYRINRTTLEVGRLRNTFWSDSPEQEQQVVAWFQSDPVQEIILLGSS